MKAELALKQYRINRLKLGRLNTWVSEQSDERSVRWCPQQFSAGRHGTGFLTIPQKKDILRHCLAMAASNRALFPREIKQAMFKMYLCNKVILVAFGFNLMAIGATKSSTTNSEIISLDGQLACFHSIMVMAIATKLLAMMLQQFCKPPC